MKAHECYHCKQWVEEGEKHDCWTTTESALTSELSEDLQDAYERLRETAVEFGEQRIYASGSCIMFSRTACYFFVRPKRKYLELCLFLGRSIKAPQVKKIYESSRVKRAHIIPVTHRDEIESPITDWMQEAYDFEPLAKALAKSAPKVKAAPNKNKAKTTAKKMPSAAKKTKTAKKKAKAK